MILTWISSRYECWDQSSFNLIHIEIYLNQHQYDQANSRFLISFLYWLDISNIVFNIYLYISSLIKSMQFFFKYLTIQANQCRDQLISNMICVLCHLTFAWHSLTYAFLIHLSTLIKANLLSNSSCSWKANHYWDQSKIINSCLIYHLLNMLAFTWCYDIPQHRSHFIDSICIVFFCLN
jgi:ABC-type transport system involved in Fe-S cluster assembly fused permease/ATPase subunit